jgi:hypothetical protein
MPTVPATTINGGKRAAPVLTRLGHLHRYWRTQSCHGLKREFPCSLLRLKTGIGACRLSTGHRLFLAFGY